jgi:putative membrane protein insertion efficiency factor
MRFLVLLPVRVYRLAVSPLLAPCCRYAPTCSAYAVEAVERHGVGRGLKLALGRILRCHPWGGSGFDPVPPALPTSSLPPQQTVFVDG